jgi:uncharacterized coiled-coil protein SlyX
MSASFDSKQFFEDAAKFFTDLQTSIDTQHTQHKESAKTEIERLRRTFEARFEKTEDIVREQRRVIESLQSTQTQQTKAIQALTGQIQALTARIDSMPTAAASMVPAPVVEPSQPKSQVQAPGADAEQENAAQDAPIQAKKAAKPKAPKSPDKEAPVAAIPESEPVTSPKATAVTTEVAAVETQEITTDQAPAVEPIVEALPVAEPHTSMAEDSNAQVLEQFLTQPTVKEIIEKLNGMPKNDLTLTKHRNVLNSLITFINPGTYPADVYEFSLNLWLLTLLLKDKTSYKGEMYTIFDKPNETKDLSRKYDGNPDLKVKIKLATMMSKNLSDTYKKDPKKYISDHSDAIRSITKSLEAHCEGIRGAESQVWIKFLNKWLNQTKE